MKGIQAMPSSVRTAGSWLQREDQRPDSGGTTTSSGRLLYCNIKDLSSTRPSVRMEREFSPVVGRKSVAPGKLASGTPKPVCWSFPQSNCRAGSVALRSVQTGDDLSQHVQTI